MQRTVVLLAMSLALVALPAAAQQSPDEQFVRDAAADGMAEVAAARDAMVRATTPEVKQFAERLLNDHRAANTELNALAERKGITPPTAMTPEHQATEARLARLSGRDYDRAWTEAMVRDHTKAVSAFERESREGQDPEVREWASRTLPTLREHLQMAQQLQSRLASSGEVAALVRTTLTPRAWCDGAWAPERGTNFGACPAVRPR